MKRTRSFHPLALCLALLGLVLLPFLGCIATADLPLDTETITIHGVVTHDGEPMPNSDVVIMDAISPEVMGEATTNFAGEFEITLDELVDYMIVAKYGDSDDPDVLIALESIRDHTQFSWAP